jgi:mannose-6-phosphate isomerase class I
MIKSLLTIVLIFCLSLANGQNKQTITDAKKTKSVKMENIPFQTIDWTSVDKVKYPGETGVAYWQTIQFPGLRVRIVEYSNGYLADHWCQKGHIVYCLEGEFVSELSTGEKIKLKKGETYVVSDKLSSHRSKSENGVKLLIIDGDFLKYKGD